MHSLLAKIILKEKKKKTHAKAAILNVQMLGFRSFEIRTIKRSVFEWIRYSNVGYLSPYCMWGPYKSALVAAPGGYCGAPC